MEAASTVAGQNGGEPVEEQKPEPVEEQAEAIQTTAHLFSFSEWVHAGEGALECEEKETGKCKNEEHFHAWICLPNTLQHHDIEEKARAAQARRKRAMRDEGDGERQPSDAFVTLEAELDDLMAGDREPLLEGIADREERTKFEDLVKEVTEREEWEHYAQDAEEFRRQSALSAEERNEEEFKQLDERMTNFGNAVAELVKQEREKELESLRELGADAIREKVRNNRIEAEGRLQYTHVYYQWLAFVCTRKYAGRAAPRYFGSLQELRDCSPEALTAVEEGVRELELRYVRGDAAGN